MIPPAPSLGPPATGKSTSKCLSKRRFNIRIVSHRANPVVHATVQINQGRVRPVRLQEPKQAKLKGKRLIATIDLRGVKKSTIVVRVVATLRNGAKRPGRRVYHTCAIKRLLHIRVTPRRDRTKPFSYLVTGTLHRPRGIPKSACTGRVLVIALADRRAVAAHRANLTKACTFSTRVSFSLQGAKRRSVTIVARFLGNRQLRSARAWPTTVTSG